MIGTAQQTLTRLGSVSCLRQDKINTQARLFKYSAVSPKMAKAERTKKLYNDMDDKSLTPSRQLEKSIKEGVVEELTGENDSSYKCVVCDKILKSKSTIKSHLKSGIHVERLQVHKHRGLDEIKLKKLTFPRGKIEYHELATTDQRDINEEWKTHDGRIEKERGIRAANSINSSKVKRPTHVGDSGRALSKLEQKWNLQSDFDMIKQGFKMFFVLMWKILMFVFRCETFDAVLETMKELYKGTSPEEALNIALQLGEIIKSEKPDYQYYCLPCKQHLKTKGTVKKHLISATHKSKVGKTGKEADGISLSVTEPTLERGNEVEEAFRNHVLLAKDACADSPTYWCTLCLKPLSVYGNLAGHLSSVKHKKKVETCHSATQTGQGPLVRQTGITYRSDFHSKGRVYVFNVLKTRPGAKADSLNIQNTFGSLGYDVFLHEDFKGEEILEHVREIQQDRTLESTGALILFILSHGCNADTFICADNLHMSLNTIKQNFTNKECPYLKGKPKIIFANFCRGQDIDENCLFFDDEPVVVEALVDTVIVHASNEGMITLRDVETGTLFVRSLCEVLSDKSCSRMFRHVFINLSDAMRQKGGTTPMAIDHVFKDFKF